ncbi:MAG: Mu-like prophage major head subunit gpT family protein [Pseudomonadota bacterium]
MELTRPNLNALRAGFQTIFEGALQGVADQRGDFVETVNSSSAEELYGWLADLQGMREWVGERVVQGLAENDYRLKNREFEMTVAVSTTAIRRDTLGTYGPKFRIMGQAAGEWQERLFWEALAAGTTGICYDGQPYFDTAHPVLAANGNIQPVSNFQDGAGPTWYLMMTNGIVKPLIEQTEKTPDFVALDDPRDHNVFWEKNVVYGTDAAGATGYAFWQMAYASRAPLTKENYEAARSAMINLTGDYGRPLGVVPNQLVVPASLEGAARRIVMNELIDGGNSNEWAGTAEVTMSQWLR